MDGPDAHAWETVKENAQPVKRGRDVRGLSARAPADALAAQRAAHEARIEATAGGDAPLQAWIE